MNEAIGLRLDKEFLKKIEILGKEEVLDRSSILRKLVYLGYRDFIKNKSVQAYKEGKITFSEASHRAGLTIWEMEQFLVEQGFKSSYSTEDLNEELKLI